MSSFSTTGIRTGVIREGDDLPGALIRGVEESEAGPFRSGDILVVAERG